MKKFKLVFIFIIFAAAGILLLTNTSTEKFVGALKISKGIATEQNSTNEYIEATNAHIKKSLEEIATLQKDLDLRFHDLNVLLEKEREELEGYKTQIDVAEYEEEKSRIIHLLDHNQIDNTVGYVKQMLELPQTIKDIREQIKIIDALKESTSIQSTIRNVSSKIDAIETFYNENKWQELHAEVRSLRKSYLTGSVTNFDRSELAGSLKTLKLIIHIKLPYLSLRTEEIQDDEVIAENSPAASNSEIVVCMMRWDASASAVTQSDLQRITDEVELWYQQVSYLKQNINFQFVGNDIWTGPLPMTHEGEIAAAVSSCDPYIDFNTLDTLIIYPGLLTPGGLGIASWEEDTVTAEGTFTLGTIRVGLSSNPFDLIADANKIKQIMVHELGHIPFSLDHANAWECGTASFDIDPAACFWLEYGNIFSAMGNASSHTGHFTLFEETIPNWLTPQTVNTDGTYNVDAIETLFQSRPKGLNIPFTTNPVCIEYRKPIMNDYYPSSTAIPPTNNTVRLTGEIPSNGCLLISICNDLDSLIDTTPDSLSRREDWIDACLPENTAFSNSDLGISSVSFTVNGQPSAHSAAISLDIDESKLTPAESEEEPEENTSSGSGSGDGSSSGDPDDPPIRQN